MEMINNKEVVEWMKFWACGRGHGEKLAHGVVASGSNFGGVQEAGRLSGIGANKKLMELSHIFVSKELVISNLFFKSTAAAMTSAIPAAVSFFCFVLVGCFGWRSLPAQSLLPQSVGILFCNVFRK